MKAQWKDSPSGGGTDTDADSDSDKDSKTDKGSKTETEESTSPKTADESNVRFWSMLMIMSLAALTGFVIKRIKEI